MRDNTTTFHPAGPGGAVAVCLMAGILVAVSYWLQGDVGINVLDEGFLWYGAWRTALGEVPIRDFTAYFPGRYYWTAAGSLLFGDGLLGLRASVAVFQAIGLALGLLVLRRVVRSWWILAIAGGVILIWMYPRHKLFEHTISLAAVYFAVRLLERPSIFRHFMAGVFVGLAAFFGMNHGLYGSISFFLVIVFSRLKSGPPRLLIRISAWGLGIFAGSLPLLSLLIFSPGFFDSVLEDRVLELFTRFFAAGHTNIALPVPWPWQAGLSSADAGAALGLISLGCFFVILPLFYLSMAGYLVFKKRLTDRTAIIAAVLFVGVPYMHHAFARADLSHLAQAIQAFLIGAMALPFLLESAPARRAAWAAVGCVLAMSLVSVGAKSPFYQKTVADPQNYVEVDVRGDRLWVRRHHGRLLEGITKAVAENVASGEGLLITGHWPILYPILEKKSPLRNFSLIFPETEDQQRQQIADLNAFGVDWVIMSDATIDHRDDLRFRSTHPLLWEYLMGQYTSVPVKGLPKNCRFMRRNNT